MKRVTVYKNTEQDCWYIRTASDMDGRICYKDREKAAAVARKNHPYENIYIEG